MKQLTHLPESLLKLRPTDQAIMVPVIPFKYMREVVGRRNWLRRDRLAEALLEAVGGTVHGGALACFLPRVDRDVVTIQPTVPPLLPLHPYPFRLLRF